MAVVYNTTVRNARLQVVANAIDAGPASGLLKIGTAGMGIVLSTIVLTDPCSTVSSGVLTLLGTPIVDIMATGGGSAAEAQITDSNGVVVVSGLTVNTAGSDIIINSVIINGGDTVTLLSGTITSGS